jgi:hypothetical protein
VPLAAGTLVVAGVALSVLVGMGFLVLAGLGAFGPGLLRECGWLNDHDEFQRQAARRAGYHAYLAGGLAAVTTVAVMKFREANLDGEVLWVAFVLVALWSTWLFSSLMAYWGAARTTARVLMAFGAFWTLFVTADFVSDPSAVGALMALAFAGPYFALAWTAGRWPKVTGATLLALSAFAFGYLFDFGRDFVGRPSQILTFVMLLVPTTACGIALLAEKVVDDEA